MININLHSISIIAFNQHCNEVLHSLHRASKDSLQLSVSHHHFWSICFKIKQRRWCSQYFIWVDRFNTIKGLTLFANYMLMVHIETISISSLNLMHFNMINFYITTIILPVLHKVTKCLACLLNCVLHHNSYSEDDVINSTLLKIIYEGGLCA